MQIKVSVIIPVYNAQKYLRECLDSVINQTLKEIEIICVDDGSTDDSLSILKEYEKKDSRVKVLQQQNKFAGVARNLGMKAATGKYFVFLDSDDFFEPELLELQYRQCKKVNADMSICGGDNYNDSTGQYLPARHYLHTEFLLGRKSFSLKTVKNYIFNITNPAPWNKMFSADFIRRHGLEFQSLRNSNDLYFVYTSLVLARRICVVNKELVHYRIGMTDNTQAKKHTAPDSFCKALLAVKAKAEAEGVFKAAERSFTNIAVYVSVYNLSSLKDDYPDSYKKLVTLIREKYIFELGIDNRAERYFYYRERYRTFRKMIFED